MLYQQGPHNGSNMGTRMHSYPIYQEFNRSAPSRCARCSAAAWSQTSVSVDNQTERVDAEIVSGNYFTMLGVKPAVGRVFNSKEDDHATRGIPVVVLSYDYWASGASTATATCSAQKILVNNYPMTVVGVSAAGFAGLDPSRSPQIRVPILMQPIVAPEWTFLHMDDRAHPLGAGVRPPEARLHRSSRRRAPMQALFSQIREYEMTLPGAKDCHPLHPRPVPEGQAAQWKGRRRLLADCATTSRWR